MGKFGFGKKDNDDADSNKSALFGSRSKDKSPNPATNPYAQPMAPPDPYMQAKSQAYGAPPRVNAGPPPSQGGGGRGRTSPLPPLQSGQGGYGRNSPLPRSQDSQSTYNGSAGYGRDKRIDGYAGGADGYGGRGGGNRYGADATSGGGYGADRYGAQNGYGADRYGSGGSSAAQGTGSRNGAGGYGGLGQPDDAGLDDKKDALFGGAKDRSKPKSSQPPSSGGYGQPPPYDGDSQQGTQSGVYGEEGRDQGYGTYNDRQLTAEEEEEEDVNATKQSIRFMKQEDVSSTRNALRMAQQAEETGRSTLARLGAQGEHIHNAEKNLDLAHNQNRIAEDKARELKTLNKSMFAVHVSNPFTASQRRKERDDDVINKHLDERDRREGSRRAEYETNQRLQRAFKDLQPGDKGYASKPQGKNLAERAKYQFEADSDDEEMENEIDSNLDALGGATGRLNALARATGQEVDLQNKHLDRISEKVSADFFRSFIVALIQQRGKDFKLMSEN
ncbi:Protein transport protein S9 plasma membrane t-SNARE [Bachmanniomyces sp. S44760]|nr:Protein transport protein S9 plasma membrane t-SNARE [Bachmanniomyces sp. S44760]